LIANFDADRYVSEKLVEDFNDLMQRVSLGNHGTSRDDQIQLTIRKMTEDQAVEIAQQIIVLALEFEGAAEDENKQ
jgi:hypothetical protein